MLRKQESRSTLWKYSKNKVGRVPTVGEKRVENDENRALGVFYLPMVIMDGVQLGEVECSMFIHFQRLLGWGNTILVPRSLVLMATITTSGHPQQQDAVHKKNPKTEHGFYLSIVSDPWK